MVDTSKKNFRQDRSCESCGNIGASLVSDNIDDAPRYLCEACMKFRLNRKMTSEEIIMVVEKHWGIEANAQVGKCDRCESDKIIVTSIDNEMFFSRCGCGTAEGFKRTRTFRIG